MDDHGELFIAIARGPKCPRCGEDGFDDWHLGKSIRAGDGIVISMEGAIRCPTCSRFFSVTVYNDGEVHSSARKRRALDREDR